MNVSVTIVQGPLAAMEERAAPSGIGAALVFEGIVRPLEEGRPLAAIDYRAYRPMADDMARNIARELVERHALVAMHVEHSVGVVPVGGVSFRLTVLAPHRKPVLRAMDEFIDRLKQDVPIWKRPVFVDAGGTP